jgi:hypothetical protein
MIKFMVIVAYFTVQTVDLDYDGTYNILLQSDYPDERASVAAWSKDPNAFKEGTVLRLKIEGKCYYGFSLLEGNGKVGSPWDAADDWINNGRVWVCNADKLEKLNE